jgi:hypothetical protein
MPSKIVNDPELPRDSMLEGGKDVTLRLPQDPEIRDYLTSHITHRFCTADLPNYQEAVHKRAEEVQRLIQATL